MIVRAFVKVVGLLIMMMAQNARAGHAIRTGTEQRLFGKDGYSVIIARVEKVWIEKSNDPVDDRDNDMVTLAPLATLAGTFDPSVDTTLVFEFFSNQPSSSISAPPKRGQMVLAVIHDHALIHEDPTPRNVIVSDTCTFVPGGSALTVLKSLDDPIIFETVQRLKKARAIAKKNEAEEKAALERLKNARDHKMPTEGKEESPRDGGGGQ